MTQAPLPRSLFAVTDSSIYLNHAAVGVLPVPSRDALHAFVDAHAALGVMGVYGYEAHMPAYRDAIGRFIGARGNQIAILRNTGDGANAIAAGLDWKPGDEVLLSDNEFPANAQPWLVLRDRGVRVSLIKTKRERLTPDVLRAHMTPNTKVVTVSWVSFSDGYRHDLAALSQVAHERGAVFCVDAIQGLGAFRLDVEREGIDALYCGGQKWMLALQGVSFLYVGERLRDRLRLASPGWRSVADIWDFLNYEQPWVQDASRFEGGTPNFIGALSLAKSVQLFEEHEAAAVEEHVLALTDRLCEGLRSAGAEVLSHRGDRTSSGIVTFTLPGKEPVAVGKTLQKQGIITTYRSNGIRVSPHGYNTDSEIDALLEVVRSA
ncbi:MAG: aminotransferase class V-fold PLP-dependent enzyme [Candidatus Eremiobacteraeota bacterium]|nr:aminotransferase class V-fold PLP-dependent enzyme [Candidatus Eremiobacteraeota bacterium]